MKLKIAVCCNMTLFIVMNTRLFLSSSTHAYEYLNPEVLPQCMYISTRLIPNI